MSTVRITVTGLDDALAKLSPKNAERGLKRGMSKAIKNAEAQAKRNASGRPGPNVGTGRLRSSITSEVQDEGRAIKGIIGSNVIYSRIQELGGTITAKGDGFLKFRTKDGAFHRVKSVTLPARPYLEPAIASPFARRVFDTIISEELDKAFTGKK